MNKNNFIKLERNENDFIFFNKNIVSMITYDQENIFVNMLDNNITYIIINNTYNINQIKELISWYLLNIKSE
jgi:hypothetical protein